MSGLSQGDPGAWLSSDCIRMINQDVIDLYLRARLNAKVLVLPLPSDMLGCSLSVLKGVSIYRSCG
jgi:hypothetical protein